MPDALEITTSPIRCTTNPSERLVRGLVGTVVLAGLGLGWWVSPWFYLIVVFAGANLLQSAITGFCPPEILFDKFADRG
jgi:hypothetical protein